MTDWSPDIPQTIQSELPPFGIKPHWVTFHFSAPANRLYDLYNAHVNRDRGDLIVWPTLDDLAGMMGLSRGDKVTPYMRELETGAAIHVRPVTKTSGKGRRYVVTLKVHPPEGFTGFLQASEWHAAHHADQPAPASMQERARGVHPNSGEVPPLEGVYVQPADGGDVHPVEGVVTSNNPNQNNEQQPTAPAARSAGDVRRTTDGSSARDESNGGCAASDQTGPRVADVVEEPAGGGVPVAQEPGGVAGGIPAPRGAAKQQEAAGGKGARKPSPFPVELRQAIYATEALLPALLRESLLAALPHGHLPNANRKVIAQALETRTVEQLGERAARRWVTYGYERDHFDGLLRKPLGVVEELLRPTPYCPAPDCEDGADLHTGFQCVPCAERIESRRAARRAGKKVPTHRPTRLFRDKEPCDVCERPFVGDVAEDGLCAGCRAEMERAFATLASSLAGERPADEEHQADEGDPYGPTEECQLRRAEVAAERLAARTGNCR